MDAKEYLGSNLFNENLEKCNMQLAKTNEYKFLVSFCDGWCDGVLSFYAEDEDQAYEQAMDYVGDKLATAFPELDIPYSVEFFGEGDD